MPRKMVRSAPPTTVRAARCRWWHPHVAVALQQGQKYGNIHARSGVIWGIPVKNFQRANARAPRVDFESASHKF